jgi:hypothetical protein
MGVGPAPVFSVSMVVAFLLQLLRLQLQELRPTPSQPWWATLRLLRQGVFGPIGLSLSYLIRVVLLVDVEQIVLAFL